MPRTALVAIGGNSLITNPAQPDVPHQWDAVRETCRHLADMVEAGWRLVITHGNGPQVGYILRRNELARHEVHTTPLDLIVADTQGAIGYMLQQTLRNELQRHGRHKPIAALVTQVLVDRADPAFDRPTKPVGGFMSQQEAQQFAEAGWPVIEDAGRGWRRVIASPQPLQIIEEEVIRTLLAADHVVIACGGGGIPVVQNPSGEFNELHGVPAVVDKDWASSLLAQHLGVDLLLISTGIEQVAIHYKTPQQQNLEQVTPIQLSRYLAEGHFAPGSMRPKMEAALHFVEQTGKPALITNPENIARALAHETGTWVSAIV